MEINTKSDFFAIYRTEYLLLLTLLLSILAAVSYAQANETNVLNSTNFKTSIVMDEGGRNLSSSNFKSDLSVYYLQGVSNSSSQKICLGFICIDFGPKSEEVLVAFVLEANISGTANDTIVIDNSTSPGLFKKSDISRYFACIQDTSLTSSPLIGIIYGGSGDFRYVKVDPGASFNIRLVQEQAGNRFIIPVTSTGCDVVKNKLPLSVPSIFTLPFVSFDDLFDAIELAITYPIDFVGNFERTGTFTLTLEKNETQIIGDTV